MGNKRGKRRHESGTPEKDEGEPALTEAVLELKTFIEAKTGEAVVEIKKTLDRRIASIEESLNFAYESITAASHKVTRLEKELDMVRSECEQMKDRVVHLEKQGEERERISRLSSLIFAGQDLHLPDSDDRLGSAIAAVLNRHLELEIRPGEIINIWRLKRNRVLVRFASGERGSLRDVIYRSKRKLKGLRIYINESLTPMRQKLFSDLLQKRKQGLISTVTTSGGEVLVAVGRGDELVRVRSWEDAEHVLKIISVTSGNMVVDQPPHLSVPGAAPASRAERALVTDPGMSAVAVAGGGETAAAGGERERAAAGGGWGVVAAGNMVTDPHPRLTVPGAAPASRAERALAADLGAAAVAAAGEGHERAAAGSGGGAAAAGCGRDSGSPESAVRTGPAGLDLPMAWGAAGAGPPAALLDGVTSAAAGTLRPVDTGVGRGDVHLARSPDPADRAAGLEPPLTRHSGRGRSAEPPGGDMGESGGLERRREPARDVLASASAGSCRTESESGEQRLLANGRGHVRRTSSVPERAPGDPAPADRRPGSHLPSASGTTGTRSQGMAERLSDLAAEAGGGRSAARAGVVGRGTGGQVRDIRSYWT